MQRLVAQLLGASYCLFELAVGVLVDLGDRGPRQDVVELVEQQQLPQPLEFLCLIVGTSHRRERRERLGLHEPVLGLAVELLYLGLGGEGAAVQLEVELAHPSGEAVLWERGEELVHTRHTEARHRGEALEAVVVLEHPLARSAPPIAPSEGEEALMVVALAPEVAPGAVQVERGDVAVVVGARVLEGVGEDAATVYALPKEEVVREVVGLAPVELVGKEAGHARAAQ